MRHPYSLAHTRAMLLSSSLDSHDSPRRNQPALRCRSQSTSTNIQPPRRNESPKMLSIPPVLAPPKANCAPRKTPSGTVCTLSSLSSPTKIPPSSTISALPFATSQHHRRNPGRRTRSTLLASAPFPQTRSERLDSRRSRRLDRHWFHDSSATLHGLCRTQLSPRARHTRQTAKTTWLRSCKTAPFANRNRPGWVRSLVASRGNRRKRCAPLFAPPCLA